MNTNDLSALRDHVDGLDARLRDILAERLECAQALKHAKEGAKEGGESVARLGREAEVLRRLAAEWNTQRAPVADAVRCWRALVAMSARAQGAIPIAVGGAGALMRAALGMFGVRDDVRRCASPERALDKVVAGDASLALLPWFAASGSGAWHRRLGRGRHVDLLVLGAYPLIEGEAGSCPRVAAVGRGPFDPSSDDRHVFALEDGGLVMRATAQGVGRHLGGFAARTEDPRDETSLL